MSLDQKSVASTTSVGVGVSPRQQTLGEKLKQRIAEKLLQEKTQTEGEKNDLEVKKQKIAQEGYDAIALFLEEQGLMFSPGLTYGGGVDLLDESDTYPGLKDVRSAVDHVYDNGAIDYLIQLLNKQGIGVITKYNNKKHSFKIKIMNRNQNN